MELRGVDAETIAYILVALTCIVGKNASRWSANSEMERNDRVATENVDQRVVVDARGGELASPEEIARALTNGGMHLDLARQDSEMEHSDTVATRGGRE